MTSRRTSTTGRGGRGRSTTGSLSGWTAVITIPAAPQATVTLNLALLERVIKSAKELGLEKDKLFARIDVFDNLSPIRLTMKNVANGLTLTAIVMPIRGDSNDSVIDTCPVVTEESERERIAAEKEARVKAEAKLRAAASEAACPHCRAEGCDRCEGTGCAPEPPADPWNPPEPETAVEIAPGVPAHFKPTAEPSRETPEQEITRLRAENEKLKAKRNRK